MPLSSRCFHVGVIIISLLVCLHVNRLLRSISVDVQSPQVPPVVGTSETILRPWADFPGPSLGGERLCSTRRNSLFWVGPITQSLEPLDTNRIFARRKQNELQQSNIVERNLGSFPFFPSLIYYYNL